VPEAPGTVVVESLSDTSIKLSWRPPVDSSGNITEFTIEDVSVCGCMCIWVWKTIVISQEYYSLMQAQIFMNTLSISL